MIYTNLFLNFNEHHATFLKFLHKNLLFRYIAGSPYAHVTVCGDVIGPAFPGDQPVILERLFPTGHGRFGKGTEYHAFNLAANTWQLHYFRYIYDVIDSPE